MKITLELVDILVWKGWEIRPVNGHVEFREPDGISGPDYQCENLSGDFPPAVAEWIRLNVPMTFPEPSR